MTASNQIRVLLAEDSRTDAELCVREMQRAGLEIEHRVVDTEQEFARGLGEFAPDVILSDFTMPKFDGMAALALARERAPDTPFIFVSGTIGEEYAIRALKNGAIDYVLKDNLLRLPAAVERALQDARDRRGRRDAERELQQFRAAMEISGDGIVLVDRASLRYIDVNQTLCDLVGYTRQELLGMTAMDLFGANREILERDYDAVIADNNCAVSRLESHYRHKDGSQIPIESRRRALHTGNGWIIVAIARDITERRRADDRIRRLNRIYRVLSSINSLIVRVRDRDELFRQACRIAVTDGGFSAAWLGVVDRKAMSMKPVAWHGVDDAYIRAIPPLSLDSDDTQAAKGGGLVQLAILERHAVVCNDIAADPRFVLQKEARDRGFRSHAIVPFLVSGAVVGVLVLYAAETNFFDEAEMKLLRDLAGDIAFALDHLEKQEKLDYLALYDQLTGLANRTLFHETLGAYLRAATQGRIKFALTLMNVERFKTVNDSLGRQAGDELLKQLAGRLAGAADGGNVARVGGDQFAIMLPEVKGRSQVVRSVERIWRECFARPFQINDTELRISARTGMAVYPNDGTDADALFANAEAALIRAQETGERHQFHARALTEGVAAQFALENQLRQALEKEQFVLHYQPKVDLETQTIVGVEALIRWQSPELGLVPPGKFIPLMEKTGLILEAGTWALKQAARDHRKWFELGLKALRVAVNVSPIQLRQRDFVGSVERAIIEGVAPTAIDLEITESLIMEDVQGSIAKLKAARDLGLSIAIDDFGTGYSSLGYLAKLPVQALKIDRSFIITMLDDPDTMTLVQTIISLAHSLRLKVVAEGVDQEEQAKMLRLLRCDEMQGYLYSKPIPFEAMTALLKQGQKA